MSTEHFFKWMDFRTARLNYIRRKEYDASVDAAVAAVAAGDPVVPVSDCPTGNMKEAEYLSYLLPKEEDPYFLDSLKLKGVPFSQVFNILGMGLEYELEFGLFLKNSPIACSIALDNDIYDNRWFSTLKLYSPRGYWAVYEDSTNELLLVLDKPLFTSLLKYYHYNFYLTSWILDLDNFEIRSPISSTIEPVLKDCNQNFQAIRKALLHLKIPSFFLATPGIRTNNTHSEWLSSTKHLNLTLEATSKFNQYNSKFKYEKRIQRFYRLAEHWFVVNYPDYFRLGGIVGGGSETRIAFEAKLARSDKKRYRFHIKLPYNFKDYNGLFNGTAKLLDYNNLWWYYKEIPQQDRCVKTDFKDYRLTLLGYTQGKRWVDKSNLI